MLFRGNLMCTEQLLIDSNSNQHCRPGHDCTTDFLRCYFRLPGSLLRKAKTLYTILGYILNTSSDIISFYYLFCGVWRYDLEYFRSNQIQVS